MLISIGEILVDIFDQGDKKDVFPGGAPFNVACNAHLYTNDVCFIGAIGDDEYGNFLENFAKTKDFRVLFLKKIQDKHTTEAIVTLENGERSFRFNRENGADYCLDLDDINFDFIKENDIVHIGTLMLSEERGRNFYYDLIKKIRATTKAKISIDINYRDDIFNSSEEAKKIFLKALKEADILKFSEDEVTLLSGNKDVVKSLNSLLSPMQLAVITLGSKGSLYYKNGKAIKVDTYPITPVDTTGAGDAFYGYFLGALTRNFDYLKDENKITKILTHANVAGALATQAKGAIGVAPTQKEIDSFLTKR